MNAQADAQKYQTEVTSDAKKYQVKVNAEALLEQQKREAEAEAYKAEQIAKAVRAKAEASKYAALQEAEGIAAKGKAEAEAKQAVLEAEAAAMEKKSEAYKKSEFAKLEMITNLYGKVLPEVAANVAAPMSNIGEIKIYDGGAERISETSANVIKQTIDVVKDVTGVDMGDIMKAGTINAKTDKNINVKGLDGLKTLVEE